MQFLSFLLATIPVHGVLAGRYSSERRDLATIQNSIGSVQSALQKLDTAVKALSTDPSTAPPVLTASQGVQAAIQNATTAIGASQPLSITDALGLQQTASGLTAAVQTTVGDLTAKKPVLDQLGVTSVALSALQAQKTASTALGQAIVSKVPAIGQGIAQQNLDQVSSILDKGIAALQAGGTAGSSAGNGTSAVPSTMPSGVSPSAASSAAPIVAPSRLPPCSAGNATSPAGGASSSSPAAGGSAQGPVQCTCPCACTCQMMASSLGA